MMLGRLSYTPAEFYAMTVGEATAAIQGAQEAQDDRVAMLALSTAHLKSVHSKRQQAAFKAVLESFGIRKDGKRRRRQAGSGERQTFAGISTVEKELLRARLKGHAKRRKESRGDQG